MPFYVDYSTKRRTIAIRDVSPVQFVICESFGYIITIEAVLNDYINHRNVTFDWVQIRGTEATLSHPNEPITTFTYTDTSDKIFRFYIDKDTARETYIDARVYHTPISFTSLGATVDTAIGTAVVKITDRQDSAKINYSRTIDTNVLGVPAVQFSLDYIMSTELLGLSQKLELFYSDDISVVPSTLIETWTQPYPDTYIAIAGYYVWALTVKFPSGYEKVYYSDMQVSVPSPVTAEAGTRIIDDLTMLGGIPSPVKLSYFTFIKNAAEINNEIYIGSYQETKSITRFGNTTNSVLDEFLNERLTGYNVITTDITKLNPSGVGSPA